MQDLGLNLRIARIRRRETLWSLGKKVNILPARLSEIERGQRIPTPEVLEKICGVLGVNVVEIQGSQQLENNR